MTAEAIALAFRADLPFVGLRDHEHDPDLDHIVPPDAARAARALPLAADDDHIRLAVADPSVNLGAIAPYLEGRRVELAIAAREELDAVLGPPPAAEPPPAPEPPRAEPSEAHAPPDPTPAPGAPPGSEEGVAAESPRADNSTLAEEPSWLQPPERRRRLVVVLVLLLLFVLAAAAVIAYLLTR